MESIPRFDRAISTLLGGCRRGDILIDEDPSVPMRQFYVGAVQALTNLQRKQ
jgi:hypothetical protein